MASNEDKQSATNEQENAKRTKIPLENPFIAFRRLADETIGSALQSLIGLPSAVTKQLEGALPVLDNLRNDNARHREEAESLIKDQRRREGDLFEKLWKKDTSASDSEVPHDLIKELERHREQHRKKWERIREAIHKGPEAAYIPEEMNSGKGDKDGAEWNAFQSPRKDTNRERDTKNPPVPGDSFHDFVDSFFSNHVGMLGPNTLGPLGAVIFSKLNNTIMSSDGFGPYLIFSPYSPIFLSNRMYDAGDKYTRDSFPYCDAFEDLLLASRGMEMVPLEERRRRQSLPQYPGRPHDIGLAASWLSRLQRQGLIEYPWNVEERVEEDDGTELGMYSRFLSSAFPRTTTQIPEQQHEASKAVVTKPNESDQQQAPSNEGILSTLTRTESTRFPDGHVETKVVLIKRFADGGETRTETVHTNHEGTGSDQDRLDDSKQTAKEEKKGWFWN